MRRFQILMLLATSAILFGQQPEPDTPEPQDQPGQPVARLGVVNGDASVRRGDSGDWVAAVVNTPLMAGDSISVAPGGSAELQLDYANFVRLSGDSEIRISQLDNARSQIQVSKGLITWRMLRDAANSAVQSEISTPAVAIHPLARSAVRVEVAPDGSTRIVVRHGDTEISTPRGTERIHEGNMMLVRGSIDDPEYQVVYASARDAWDTWNDQRDSYLERAQSNRYVSPDINGAEDLDAYGRWGYDPAYGNVWTPTVADTWAPYRNGQWVWEDYYGWTWVDYAPWGWAPFHYGSWYFRTGYGWSWFPGARYGHYWWHPAMVGFFGLGGGVGVGVGFGHVGWCPLAPFEQFHPWYGRGWNRGAFAGGRLGNVTIVRNTNVVNVYRNARYANGVTAVSAQDFQRGSFRNQVTVNRNQLQQASLVRGGVPVAPTASNLRFSERPVSPSAIPRGGAGNERFFSRMPARGNSVGVAQGGIVQGGIAQRTPSTERQGGARSGFGGGEARGTQPQATTGGNPGGNSGWRRFGEPSQSLGSAGGVQPRSFQPRPSQEGDAGRRFGSDQGGNQFGNRGASPERIPNRTPDSNAGARWDRFGSPRSAAPERFSAPEPAPSNRPAYNQGNFGNRGFGGQTRSLQVAPPMMQQRQAPGGGGGGGFRGAPSSGPSFRSAPAPGGNRGGGGGGGGNRGSSGGHGGGRR
jgi:hypothetical protein